VTTLVPASPVTIPEMSASDPIAARLPVVVVNRAAASTFGPIEPAANSRPARSSGVTSCNRRCWRVPLRLIHLDPAIAHDLDERVVFGFGLADPQHIAEQQLPALDGVSRVCSGRADAP
jgi:hypothetical protein